MTSKTQPKGDVVSRAFAAYYRSESEQGAIHQQPANTSDVWEVEGKQYVVLENVNGVLAVYRVTNQGQLKRLRRWPAALDGDA